MDIVDMNRRANLVLACGIGLLGLAFMTGCSGRESTDDPSNPEILVADLGASSDDGRRATAARVLGAMKYRPAVAALIGILKDDAVAVRIASVEALGQIGDPAAVDPLCQVLAKDTRELKIAAARALGILRDPRALSSLVGALGDIRDEAILAIVTMQEAAIPALIGALQNLETRDGAAEALAFFGLPAIEPLQNALNDDSKPVRLAAASALGEINHPIAIKHVSGLLNNATPELASLLYRFMIRSGEVKWEPLLIQTLKDRGTARMARDFVSSGNARLKAAAEAWATANNNELIAQTSRDQALWGKPQAVEGESIVWHFDDSLNGGDMQPSGRTAVKLVPGKWGNALSVAENGTLAYPVAGVATFRQGTMEMWVALTLDGNDPAYKERIHPLVIANTKGKDQFIFARNTDNTFYAGIVVGPNFFGVGGGDASHWKRGQWHHLALTYSPKLLELYLDGILLKDFQGTNMAPPADLTTFYVNSAPWGQGSAFLIDELRISSDVRSLRAIRVDSALSRPFADADRVKPLVSH